MINQFRRSIRRSLRSRRQKSTSQSRIGNELVRDSNTVDSGGGGANLSNQTSNNNQNTTSSPQNTSTPLNSTYNSPAIQRLAESTNNNNNSTTKDNNTVQQSTTVTSLSRFQDDTPIDPNKSPEWQEDERNVRQGQCNFKIKFVGYIEVKDPRGMPVCEDAVKELRDLKKNKKKYGSSSVDPNNAPQRGIIARLSFRKRNNSKSRANTNASSNSGNQDPCSLNIEGDLITGPSTDKWPNGRKHKIVSKKAVLWISPDSLRVVEDKKKTLLTDQTIEKVSFCAPDRHFVKSFSYICRDGTTRKWWCYTFTARKKVSGERLSHAVGCAFTACLKRKLDLEKHAKNAQIEAQENEVGVGEGASGNDGEIKGVTNLVVRSQTEPVLNVADKKLQKNASMVYEKHEEIRAERTKILVEEKHPELRKSMRSRPKRNPAGSAGGGAGGSGSTLPTPVTNIAPPIPPQPQAISTPVAANPSCAAPLIPPSSAIIQPNSQNSGFDPLQPQKTIDELLAQNPTPTPSTENKILVDSPSNWNPWDGLNTSNPANPANNVSGNNNNNVMVDSGFQGQNSSGFSRNNNMVKQAPTQLIMAKSPAPLLSSNNPFLQDHVPGHTGGNVGTPADQWLNEITNSGAAQQPMDNVLLI